MIVKQTTENEKKSKLIFLKKIGRLRVTFFKKNCGTISLRVKIENVKITEK